MNLTPLTEITELGPLSEGIDFSRHFMPEELTPFFFTPAYAGLTEEQKLRYNQLNALYFNEQTMFFEVSLAQNVLGYFLSQPLPEELKEGLRRFLKEEQQHSEMFRQLNRQCAPGFYAKQDFYFIHVSPPVTFILKAISKHPQWFPFLLWLMHLQEERAMYFGKVFLKSADSLEPHFVSVQRKHLADEIGHVHWDESLLDWIWPKISATSRRFNIRILSWMLKEYFTCPKRTAPRVLSELVKEFPELQPQYPEFCSQLRALGSDSEYRRSLYCSENVPMTFKRFDAWPEFRAVIGAMPGYVPGNSL